MDSKYWAYDKRLIEQMPIYTVDFSDSGDLGAVRPDGERMLTLHERLPEARFERD